MNDRRRFRVLIVLFALIMAAPVVVLVLPSDSRAGSQQAQEAEGLALKDWPMSESATRGRVVYERYCIGCHGNEGRGDGPASKMLSPRPRNFQHGAFKFRSTPYGKLPLASDLVNTITWGLPGSSMPEFRLVPEVEREDVAQYVLHLATLKYGEREVQKIMKREGLSYEQVVETRIAQVKGEVWNERVDSMQAVAVPPSPPVTPELLALGKKRYLGECNRCHGDTGRGDGNSSFTLRDWKDDIILARDFTGGVFRAGSRPEDIFRRMRTGLSGTPMPAIPGTDEEIWGLAHYIVSLKDPSTYVNRVHAGRGVQGGK
ncbi:MAG: cytochrome c [Planctomycetes bacterium]|nr:cytochrome c [Planctomycetota bacterium]